MISFRPFAEFFAGIVMFFSCLGNDFDVEQATYSQVKGGVQKAGIMLTYTVDVQVCKSSEKLDFLYLYARQQPWRIDLLDRYGNRIGQFEKKDRLTLRASGRYFPEGTNPPADSIRIPQEYRGKDLIIYERNGKRKWKELEDLQEARSFNAP